NNCCVFPFVYRGKRFNSCTRARHNRPWCAITPNYDGECCVFPFIYKGRRYNACTRRNSKRGPWCSLTNNYDKDRKWGYC
ncbi:predicted protein, partial [Nematostella vectensis]